MFPRCFAFQRLSQQYPSFSRLPGLQATASPPTWRYFSSSIPRAKAAVKPQPQPRKVANPEETLKFAGRRPEGFGKLERKVAREGNVILFNAPSHRSYIFGAYSLAAFCFAYSVYNSNMIFRDPIAIGIPIWQQTLFGGVCIAMSVMGTVFLTKTGRLIKSVNAVSANGQTHIRFRVRSMIPFKKAYEFDALPRQIAFSRRLVVTPGSVNRTQQPEAPRNTKPSEMEILKAPAKKISVMIWTIFANVRKLFTQEGVILLEVEGQKGVFRMDSAGFVSEDFLMIGNPLDIKRRP
ncbi:hypothetical protein SI65_10320 [Aspergillus cristatus]|uniref:Uncharacterized protein n=1 Tax=Aspergillus cristatus TaxID=573508 RepID=A0A1E3B014_ASPCR|nr:hypothetical protein SI65_10320 [Aspergillus cristatus]